MEGKNIVLLGVKGSVLAFRRDTGARLWTAKLKSSMSSDFVSVAADDHRVYAHTAGELFCLDLQTGNLLWSDKLEGLGYGVASLAFPGTASSVESQYERKRQQDAAAASAATSASSS